MYNLFFKILILVIILSTISILGLKPKMHSKVLIYDSSYTIVEKEPETIVETKLPEQTQTVTLQKNISNETKKEVQNIKTMPKKVTVQNQNKNENKNETKKEIVTSQKPKTTTAAKVNQVVSKAEPKKQEIVKTTTAPKQETTKVQTPKQETVKTTTKPKEETAKTQAPKQVQTQTLSEKEEEIAWNIWRSNLQNQIMKDTRLPYVPKGTIFKFTFDVDKYGRITSVKTWSTNPNYTPIAIQYIAPVIRSYQGKNILDFPSGTQRLQTTVKGGWKISDSAKYSTPNDYNDIEKVKK